MIDLHCHSTLSFKDGIGTMEQIADRLLELNREVMVLTDHDNIYSAPLMEVWAKPKGLKCIYGCEIRTVKDIELMKENKQRKKNHLTLLSKTTEGYGNLCKLVTFANMDGHYYFPTIDFDVLEMYKKGLIVLSGCPSSYLYELILDDEGRRKKDLSEAVNFCKDMKNMLDGNFYMEIMPHDLEMVHQVAPVLRAIAKKLDIPMVLTNDSHFLTADQARVWKLMRAIRLNTTVDMIDDSLQSCYYMEDDEAWHHAKDVIGKYFTDKELLEMFNNQEKIVSECNAEIEKVGSVDSGVDNPHEELVARTYQGLKDKGLDKPEYRERLEKELDLVGRKGFSDYFLVVADLVQWCKSHDILVGASRGSAGGFLTSYCMDIIDLDPLPFDLVMERFLSEDRVDPPDIDLDFQASLRDNVIRHLQDKYGENNVAHITTFQHYKGKNTLIDVGKAYGIPMYEVDKVKNVLLERGKADARASATIEDTFYEFSQAQEVAEKYPGIMDAQYLEGQIRHAGVNAAGILVTRRPMDGTCSFREKDSKWVASVDLYGAELIDTLKLDILGIKELDILKEMCESTDVDERTIFHLGLDDRKVLDIFEGNTLGVFQFGATGTASLIKQLTPINTFDDIVLANALCLRWSTNITMADGTLKRIEEVEVGDRVISVSLEDKTKCSNVVKQVFDKGYMSVYRIDSRTSFIDATLDHAIYTPDGWKKVRDLKEGGYVSFVDGDEQIISINYLSEEHCYDLSMENQELNNFIANGFIVHNSRPGPLHCLAYNSIIYDGDKDRYVHIEKAFGDEISSTYSRSKDGTIKKFRIKEIIDTGKQPVYELRLAGANACRATLNHRFFTKSSGWKILGHVCVSDEILMSYGEYHKIISIIYSGHEQTYDIEMESSNDFFDNEPNFIANDIIVHNSGQAVAITDAKREGTYKTWNTGVESVDDILNDITKSTYGFMVFQEQIMRTMREVGDLSWQEVASIRNAMSKSLGDEFFNKFRAVFIEGSARLHGLPANEADNIYDHVIHFGNWAFNKSFSGNTLILNTNPNQFAPKWITIKELYENKGYATPRWKEQPEAYKKMNTLSLCDDGKLRPGRIKDVFYHGEVELYRIVVESGRYIDITANHRLIDDNFNFIHGRDIELGTVLLMNGGYDKRKYEGSGEGSGWTTNYSGHVNPETGKVFKDLAYSEVERFKELRKGTSCDSCGKEYDGSRFEAHHNTIDPPNSDLKWLCNSCHKKADYELGNRIGIWSSGYKIVAEKVIEKYSMGVEDCYDIEMEDPTRPTFIANGFVSHNSHSVGYSLISWATAYFKAHYPQQFYRSLCNFNEDEKLKKLLREYIEHGHGKILPPKIGKSEEGWTVEGKDLRAGLADILPKGACEEILSLYPIKDAEDLEARLPNRRKVNSRVWKIIEENELFSDNDNLDPFGLYEFAERMSRIQDRTHKIGEIGYHFKFRDVIIAGIMDRQFNEKSYAELMQSQKTKDFSHLKIDEYGDAWGIMFLVDETGGPVNVHFKNYLYPRYKDWIWKKSVNQDIIVIKGIVPPNMNYVIAKEAWDGEEVKASGGRCFKCPLIDEPMVPPTGPKDAEIMLLGMVPGENEVKEFEPFVGVAGKVLDEQIIKAGSHRKKFRITNACICRSSTEDGRNRDPSDEELSCCNGRLMQEIDDVQPKVIMPLGRLAYKALTGDDVPIGSVEGIKMEWGDYVVIPTYHPASCLYSDGDAKRAKIRKTLEYALKIAREME